MKKHSVNAVKRSELANTLALHDFALNSYDLKAWVAYVVDLFRQYGLEPTRMGISAPSIKSTKMHTYAREVKKLDTTDNQIITGISLQATMNGSDDSANDDIFTAIFDIGLERRITTCTLVLDDALVPLEVNIWNEIAKNIAIFFKPRYGYSFQRAFKKGPTWYPWGTIGRTGNTKISDQEADLITCWANAYQRSHMIYQTGDLRDIYPLNILSSTHNQRLVDEKPLFDWIQADARHGTLTQLEDNLWSWWVEESQIHSVRDALKPTGILLCAP